MRSRISEGRAQTPLQAAQAALLAAIAAARETLDEREHRVFVDIAIVAVAREAARHLTREGTDTEAGS
jgi:hypothetical protein